MVPAVGVLIQPLAPTLDELCDVIELGVTFDLPGAEVADELVPQGKRFIAAPSGNGRDAVHEEEAVQP